jgi:2-oxoglutarate/2-oxoacid ferredoxin oxidoreductase subunit alpha
MLQQIDRVATGGEGLQRVNEFVVKFANVNGSGSASANALFAKAILRMGIVATPGTRCGSPKRATSRRAAGAST